MRRRGCDEFVAITNEIRFAVWCDRDLRNALHDELLFGFGAAILTNRYRELRGVGYRWLPTSDCRSRQFGRVWTVHPGLQRHPEPNLEVGAHAWILAGGAHHTSFSMALNTEYLEDFDEMNGFEFVNIDNDTNIREFKKELKWNDVTYLLGKPLK